MNLAFDLAIIAALLYSGFTGTKRGLILISLELSSFVIATGLTLVTYRWVGGAISSLTHISTALGNVAAFVVIWSVTEVLFAILIRFGVLHRFTHHAQFSLPNRLAAATINTLKTAAVLTFAIIVYAGLPLDATIKRPITQALVSRVLLASTGDLQSKIAAGIGRDIRDSLNVYTITSDPESEQRIELGFTTTAVKESPKAEIDMLALINTERKNRGLEELTINLKARAVARAYSIDMFARGYFSHINPEGKNPFDRMRAGGVKFGSAGENLALAPNLALAHDGLMKSPGHRDNILSKDYRAVGIGIVDGGKYGLMVTQEFTD